MFSKSEQKRRGVSSIDLHLTELNNHLTAYKNIKNDAAAALMNSDTAPELYVVTIQTPSGTRFEVNYLQIIDSITATEERINTLEKIKGGQAITRAEHANLLAITAIAQDSAVRNYDHIQATSSASPS